ncbi:DUF262 domain-containing protein [Arsenicibacter rosenii]|uniref:DUF262 domain-containing protein n=1 Tax=Arsenicibacter rosenii TaxID=1750698 RepID=A0A1S2VEJ0_9BACT|nr:DUF262 domain-containing protein [Arsenicibacter rosenii]OIN56695.1 hypothetical protein BLX24_23195 [Arsenicibacter rosenii]
MAVGSFSTSNQTYRMLMGNGLLYSVPRFQRDYSWTDEFWDDLWHDIDALFLPEGESVHYMGYLVLQTEDNKNFGIIDGQQRLTTLSIVVLAALSNLRKLIDSGIDAEANTLRLQQLRSSFIGYLDPVTLISRSKLSLNRNNNTLFQQYLIPLQPTPKRGLKATEQLMRKAFDWFDERVNKRYTTGEALAKFIDQLSDKLFFTVITVSDELNAYKVFETLNARGVKLSSTDLLKNHLFQVVDNQNHNEWELNDLDNRWEGIVSKLGSESFPDFLRTHWNSRRRFLRHAELYKRIRDSMKDRSSVFNLMREMEMDVDVYVALSKPDDELWTPEQRKYIRELKLFNVRQIYPLLISAYRCFNQEDFTKLLRISSVVSFRYNVIGNLPTNEQDRLYPILAESLTSAKITTLPALIHELKPLYPTDASFKIAFADKVLKTPRNRQIVRYILFKLESYESANDYDFDSERYNIEHILPENPAEGWESVSDQDHEQFVFRLGNMTIMNADANRRMGNIPYEAKRLVYQDSEFVITRKIAETYSEWGGSQIAGRQRQMAASASVIWRVNQLK